MLELDLKLTAEQVLEESRLRGLVVRSERGPFHPLAGNDHLRVGGADATAA